MCRLSRIPQKDFRTGNTLPSCGPSSGPTLSQLSLPPILDSIKSQPSASLMDHIWKQNEHTLNISSAQFGIVKTTVCLKPSFMSTPPPVEPKATSWGAMGLRPVDIGTHCAKHARWVSGEGWGVSNSPLPSLRLTLSGGWVNRSFRSVLL